MPGFRAVVLLALLASGPGLAGTIYVDDNNTGYQNGSATYPYRTITGAVAVAGWGTVIQVAAGVYPDAVTISNRNGLKVLGAGASSIVTNAGCKFRIESSTAIALQGLRITGGSSGIQILNSTNVDLTSNLIERVSQSNVSSGGAVIGSNSSIRLYGNVIQQCYGGQRGGIGYFVNCPLDITDNHFANNTARNSSGGLYVSLTATGCPVRLHRNLFRGCRSGAVDIRGNPNGQVEILNNLVVRCGNDLATAGIIRLEVAAANATNRIVNNVIHDAVPPFRAASIAIYLAGAGPVYLANNIFSGAGAYALYGCSGSRATAEYNCLSRRSRWTGVALGAGTITAVPQYVSPDSWDYRLQAVSPCRDAGHPASACNDPDGSRNDMGVYGGPESTNQTVDSGLLQWQEDKLNEYASATVRYFTSTQANNTTVGFPHAFYGTGKRQFWNGTRWAETNMMRGFGSHVCINEVTLRFLSLAAAYKMNWLTYLPPSERYTNSWGQVLRGLQTLRYLQTSGNTNQYFADTFHRMYLTSVSWGSATDIDRAVYDIVRDPGVDVQSSDDNALPWMNLCVLEGLAGDRTVDIPDRAAITNLCREIRGDINLRRFLVDNQVVHDIEAGVPSGIFWDRAGTEGPVILSAMLLSGQITKSEFFFADYYLKNAPVNWTTLPSGTIPIGKSSFHAAICSHGLRAVHGMPITSAEFSTNITYFAESLRPIFEAQVDYALYYGYGALGSHVASQELWGQPLVELSGVLCRFPGNDTNRMPVYGTSLARATAPHGWFMPLQRSRELAAYDVDNVFAWTRLYETNFLKKGADVQNELGWEATVPWKPADTTYTWRASSGVVQYTDWGRPFEALNAAYLVLGIFDALNPTNPLASYHPERIRLGHLAAFFDEEAPLPSDLFP